MNNLIIKNITQEKKIDMIFNYLFSNNKSIEEEFFWNILNNEEIQKIKKIQKEEKFDLDNLKGFLGK